MLLRWIEQTRKKPKEVRNQYALFGAVITTLCIALVWGVTLPYKFKTIGQAPAEVEETTGAFAQFLSHAKDNFATALKARKAAKEEEVTESTEETRPEPIIMPVLNKDTIEDVQDEYEESLLPQPRQVLIETTSKQHTNATTTAE